MKTDLAFCTDLSIYLGHACNFDCSYCDRSYIRNTIGGQGLNHTLVDAVVELVLGMAEAGTLPTMISFHGGEPLYYVRLMHSILSRVQHVLTRTRVFIQTNGSLIVENAEFFHEFSHLEMIVSISYDFAFQGINRTEFNLRSALRVLKSHGIRAQLQYVIPLDNPKCMSFEVVREILSYTAEQDLVSRINLIPLRHIRGNEKFRLILDQVDMSSVFFALLKFVELLYVMGVKVIIDGHSVGVEKEYFHEHPQVILSPDGKVYPEYDFLEYRMHNTCIGTWSSTGIVLQSVDEDSLVNEECVLCAQTRVCGLKYLFKEFNRAPVPAKCTEFYRRLTMVTKHIQKLNTNKSLVHWMAEK